MSVYKDTEKIYLIAAIESLINRNENNATDLGNYILEYKLKGERYETRCLVQVCSFVGPLFRFLTFECTMHAFFYGRYRFCFR